MGHLHITDVSATDGASLALLGTLFDFSSVRRS
jgi:hypothetical protein